MNLIELREKRLEVWNKAKAFLDSHRKRSEEHTSELQSRI